MVGTIATKYLCSPECSEGEQTKHNTAFPSDLFISGSPLWKMVFLYFINTSMKYCHRHDHRTLLLDPRSSQVDKQINHTKCLLQSRSIILLKLNSTFFLLKYLIFCVWLFCMHICLCLICMPDTCRGQKRDPLELNLHMVVSHHICAGI